jgi:hypothetical protein
MLDFDNPPDYVSIDPPRPSNPLPILHGFNLFTGNYFRNGREFPGLLIFQPLCYRWKYIGRNGNEPKDWFDVMFLTRLNRLGLLSLPHWYGIELDENLRQLKARSIQPYGVWLCMNRRVNKARQRTYVPFVDSFYWSSRWDCMNAERTLTDLKTKPWSQSHDR